MAMAGRGARDSAVVAPHRDRQDSPGNRPWPTASSCAQNAVFTRFTLQGGTMKNEIRVPAALGASTINSPAGANLTAATDEVINAALDTDDGPGEPASFHNLRGRLEAVREKFPPLYQ